VAILLSTATNAQLPARVREGTFREDLFFRLSTVMLDLPPLRERGDDLLLIAQALLTRLAREHDLAAPALTADLRRRLRTHPWPGNVRELKNALERALLLSPAGELSADELLPPAETAVQHEGPIPFPAPLHTITTAAAQATVQLCGGNRSESARRLGISPRRLRRLLTGGEDLGLDLEEDDLAEPLLHTARGNVRWRGRFARPATHGLVRPE
jgi:DNA-binding NtrC family response regulator